jgi:two-component system, NtrC family, sensor kinase
MKLARKLTVALVIGIVVVMVGYAYFQIRQEVVLSQADLKRAARIGLAWLGTIEAVWEHEGSERAYELAARATKRARDITLRIVPLDRADAAAGELLSAAERQRLLHKRVVRRIHTDEAGHEWRQIYAPLVVPGGEPTVVEYAEPMQGEQTFIKMSHLAIATATLAVVMVCGLIVTGLQYSLVGRPLKLLRDKARRAGAGDFSHPLLLPQTDEIGELARELNAMCDHIAAANRTLAEETQARIAALDQLRHTERLATVGRLAAGVAHELGTPLSVVSARAQVIASGGMPSAGVVATAGIIVEQCDRMTDIIHQLLDFSRRRGVRLGLTDLRHVVTRTLELLSSAAERARVEICCDADAAPVLVHIDQNQMQQALTNVVLNGIQAMPEGGQLHVRIASRHARPPTDVGRDEGEYPCVTVEDQGTGIRADHLARIFEPFFTTKSVGDGTGLGLAVAHGIVAEHGGWITVASEVGKGSRFAIFLPPAGDAPAVASGVA